MKHCFFNFHTDTSFTKLPSEEPIRLLLRVFDSPTTLSFSIYTKELIFPPVPFSHPLQLHHHLQRHQNLCSFTHTMVPLCLHDPLTTLPLNIHTNKSIFPHLPVSQLLKLYHYLLYVHPNCIIYHLLIATLTFRFLLSYTRTLIFCN